MACRLHAKANAVHLLRNRIVQFTRHPSPFFERGLILSRRKLPCVVDSHSRQFSNRGEQAQIRYIGRRGKGIIRVKNTEGRAMIEQRNRDNIPTGKLQAQFEKLA